MEKKNQVPKYPPLRFPEFTDEWKKVKLGEVLKFFSTNTLSWEQLDYAKEGTINIHYGLIHKALPTLTDVTSVCLPIVRNERDVKNSELCQDGDILIADASEDTDNVGKSIELIGCNSREVVAGLHTLHGRSQEDFAIGFKGYLLASPGVKKQLQKIAQGVKVYSINPRLISPINLWYPSLPEQKKIAALLSLIDERIEVQNAIIKEREAQKALLSKELLTPEDDWAEYAVRDCLSYEQPTKYLVKHTDYSSDSTLTPVLTANKGFILGYTSEQGIYQKGACIIFDDFTLDCKYVPFAFKVKSSAIKILQARKGFDIRFMFEVIKSLSLSPFAHKRHYISEVEPIKVLVPSLPEQRKIAALLSAVDERIAVEKEYAALLQKQKAYLLRQMFV